MELEDLQRHWQALGEQDPLWAILTASDKRGGAWDLDEFLATGRSDVAQVLGVLSQRGIAIERERALDFGCGVGRLTQVLADHFDSCDGVDVAASMIGRARAINRRSDRVHFHHNQSPDLRLFEDGRFTFVLSLLVLQHMGPDLMRGYLREFVRVLRPGGVAYFNIPERIVFGAAELPAEAWRASLTLRGERPMFTAGRVAPLELTVRNDSGVLWPVSAEVRVGNHWRAGDGAMVAFDDARALIDPDLAPGQERNVRLEVTAPHEPGDYVLEIDLVQEWVSWFADRGSSPLWITVTVTDARDSQANGDGDQDVSFTPRMEMHALDREAVAAVLEQVGGVVLEVVSMDRCGPQFPSVDYIVRRRLTPVRTPTRLSAKSFGRVRRHLIEHFGGVVPSPKRELDQLVDLLFTAPLSDDQRRLFDSIIGDEPTITLSTLRRVIGAVDQQATPTPVRIRWQRADVSLLTVNDVTLYVDDADSSVGLEMRNCQSYEPHLTKAFRAVCRSGMDVVDVGANIGYYTMLAAGLVGPTGTVTAFEPSSENVRLLLSSVKSAGYENVQVHPVACGAENGWLAYDSHVGTNGGLRPSSDLLANPVTIVASARLDDVVNSKVDIMKVDVEGAEGLVMQGAERLVREYRPIIFSELSCQMLSAVSHIDAREYLEWFFRQDYEVSIVVRGTGELDTYQSADELLGGWGENILRIEDLRCMPKERLAVPGSQRH